MAGKTKAKSEAAEVTAPEATAPATPSPTPSPGDDLAGLAAREAMARLVPAAPAPTFADLAPEEAADAFAALKTGERQAYMATRPIFAEGWPPVEEGEVLFDPDPAFLAVAAPGALVPAQLAD